MEEGKSGGNRNRYFCVLIFTCEKIRFLAEQHQMLIIRKLFEYLQYWAGRGVGNPIHQNPLPCTHLRHCSNILQIDVRPCSEVLAGDPSLKSDASRPWKRNLFNKARWPTIPAERGQEKGSHFSASQIFRTNSGHQVRQNHLYTLCSFWI